MPSRFSPLYEVESLSGRNVESGYVSGSGSETSIPELYFTKPHLHFLNRQLQNLEPQGRVNLRNTLPAVTDGLENNRNPTMVHHHSALSVPDYRFRPDWVGHCRHALKDEDSKTSDGRPHLPRYPPPFPGNPGLG